MIFQCQNGRCLDYFQGPPIVSASGMVACSAACAHVLDTRCGVPIPLQPIGNLMVTAQVPAESSR